MSALELDTLDYGDCLEWIQRWDDQCVDLIYPDGKRWAQVLYFTLFREKRARFFGLNCC